MFQPVHSVQYFDLHPLQLSNYMKNKHRERYNQKSDAGLSKTYFHEMIIIIRVSRQVPFDFTNICIFFLYDRYDVNLAE